MIQLGLLIGNLQKAKTKIKMNSTNYGNYYDVTKNGKCVGFIQKYCDMKWKFVSNSDYILEESDLRWIADRLMFLNK